MREITDKFNELLQILNCESKRELKKISKSIIVNQQDLVMLILLAQRGELSMYLYANHFEKKVPKHLMPNKKELESISKNGVGSLKTAGSRKFSRKIFQIQIEHRSRVAHLFYTQNFKYWHLFYFDNRDKSKYKNHWKSGGSHIHFISYLWSNLSLESVWKKVESGNLNFSDKLHLKYKSNNKKF